MLFGSVSIRALSVVWLASALPLLAVSPCSASSSAEKGGKLRRGDGRRMEGFSGDVPEFGEFASADERDSGSSPAQSLSYFKNGMDPNMFQWVNKEEVKPGGVTCGFMYPPLGSQPNEVYPAVEVYVCMKFATTQPASKGNLFVHCGGPGSMSGCVVQLAGLFTPAPHYNRDFNVIAIDQRGLGRSEPSLFHEECVINYEGFKTSPGFDWSNATAIGEYVEAEKARKRRCWNCEDCGFRMQAEQEDGTTKTYHFLEYSGTRQLAEDIERFRQLIDAPKLSLYGLSYGTQVVLQYATQFPDKVDKLVSDSNMPPTNDLYQFSYQDARFLNDRINYQVYLCDQVNFEKPGACPVEDLSVCVDDILSLPLDGMDFNSIIGLLINADSTANSQELCNLAAAGDADGFSALMEAVPITRARRVQESSRDCSSLPTIEPTDAAFFLSFSPEFAELFGDCATSVFGKPNYQDIKGADTNPYDVSFSSHMIIPQDYYGGSYNKEEFIQEVIAVNKKFRGLGTQIPAGTFASIWGIGFNWPRSVPLQPRGNPDVEGIVSGQLFDAETPYVWTQEMRASFPSMSLVTVQSINHGLNSLYNLGKTPAGEIYLKTYVDAGYPNCQSLIDDYLDTGVIGFPDGYVCPNPFPWYNLPDSAAGFGSNTIISPPKDP